MINPDFSSYLPEHFKEHPDCPGIWVGNFGTILSTRKRGCSLQNIAMDPYGAEPYSIKIRDFNGYLTTNNFGFAHRLVAKVWLPNPDNLPEVNHKDEDKTNNSVVLNDDLSVNLELSNLEWCTREYNLNYGTHNARISAAITGREPWNKGKKIGPLSAELRAKLKISLKGKNKGSRGYHWYTDPLTGERYMAKSPRNSEN